MIVAATVEPYLQGGPSDWGPYWYVIGVIIVIVMLTDFLLNDIDHGEF